MSVFVVFGSASDSSVYETVADECKAQGLKAEVRVLSAHRTPKQLEKALRKTRAKVFIAGAGVSAALPGVVKSHQPVRPVIGIPVHASYFGLDALLSVHQMPPGMPVLGVGVNQGKEAVREAKKILSGKKSGVVFIKSSNNVELINRLGEAQELLKRFEVPFEEISLDRVDWQALDESKVYIDLIDLMELDAIEDSNALVIHVPIAKPNLPEQAILILDKARTGLWVAICGGANAALAAIEVLNVSNGNKYAKKLLAYRKELEKKVLKADKELQSRSRARKRK
ncbi:MAG TPA: AIR carboxylase family protein [Candidatus Diapherotrites archaeon]|uniref:AIR carboxylase family protein n=1 Tax=Candidatus Iainarchaeum sp. TaxID=3101447 RepID=A0A7J4JM95_9ARCH|nr:AIR carboxylase family protein [Candidatus Diapherotrites archaeon]HIH16376.1 AIR carboxylase family protein [Candidatus Diapherotrites archaeon]